MFKLHILKAFKYVHINNINKSMMSCMYNIDYQTKYGYFLDVYIWGAPDGDFLYRTQ